MPVAHITIHAYASWMPDRPQGWVHRKKGLQPTNRSMADDYRRRQTFPTVRFSDEQQHVLLNELRRIAPQLSMELIAAGLDASHVHTVIAWRDDRTGVSFRRNIKHWLTRKLNESEERPWFVRKGSVKLVRTKAHLSYLRTTYLPDHKLFWDRSQ